MTSSPATPTSTTPARLTVTPGTFATNDGGTVTIEADGDFTLHARAGDELHRHERLLRLHRRRRRLARADRHRPRDDPDRRLRLVRQQQRAAGGGGTSAAPFDTLVEAETASAANHTVFVFDGDNTATGYGGDGYAMDAGERLIGEHEGLQVDPDGGGRSAPSTLHPANAGAHPTLTATNADVIDLDDGNEIRGLNIDPQGTGGGIAGGTGDTGGATIDDVNITDTGTAGTQPGLELERHHRHVQHLQLHGQHQRRDRRACSTTPAPSTSRRRARSRSRAPARRASTATGTNMGTSTFDAITVTGSGNGGVEPDQPDQRDHWSTTFGDLVAHNHLRRHAASCLNNAGNVSPCRRPATANVSATGGPAVDVTGTSGATLAFDDVSSTNSANDGINLDGPRHRHVQRHRRHDRRRRRDRLRPRRRQRQRRPTRAPSTTAPAQTAEITGRTGGAVTLSGAIADTQRRGRRHQRCPATPAAARRSATRPRSLNTGDSGRGLVRRPATATRSTLSGGGLDVDTTSGAGHQRRPTAARSTVTGAGNTIATTHAAPRSTSPTPTSARRPHVPAHLRQRRGERHRAQQHRRERPGSPSPAAATRRRAATTPAARSRAPPATASR